MSDKTRNLLIGYCKKYPKLQPQDLFKFLYQSAFGCEHFVLSYDKVVEKIKSEYERVNPVDDPVIEELGGNYCRVPLSFINIGVTPEKIGELFFLSARSEKDGLPKLLNDLEIVKDLMFKQLLPFDKHDFEKALTEWLMNGYQPLHHSTIYREEYLPSYRVVAKEYISLLVASE